MGQCAHGGSGLLFRRGCIMAGELKGDLTDVRTFLVGHDAMDELHREFHERLGAFGIPGDEGEKLLALHEHLLRHCAQEEHWMRETDFKACACHVGEHDMLLDVVSEVRRRFDAGDSEVVVRLYQELPQWFALHASTMDSALAEHLHARALAMQPTPAARRAAAIAQSA